MRSSVTGFTLLVLSSTALAGATQNEGEEAPSPWLGVKSRVYVMAMKSTNTADYKDAGFYPQTLPALPNETINVIYLVRYLETPVGPYDEIAFLTSPVVKDGTAFNTVTKIYVSTSLTLSNGQKNWGIPKELANFEFRTKGDKEYVSVWSKANTDKKRVPIVELAFDNSQSKAVPLIKDFMAQPTIQHFLGREYSVRGVLKSGEFNTSKLVSVESNPGYFPKIDGYRKDHLLFTYRIENFVVDFHERSPNIRIPDAGSKTSQFVARP